MRRNRPRLNGFLTGVAVTALCVTLWFQFGLGERLELQSLDFRFRSFGDVDRDSRIVHVDIDDNALDRIGRWPWPAKSKFLANMSHEIRTPINGIKGFISLLGQSSLNQTQQRYIDIVLKSTNDLSGIVNEILDFSKMESGKLQIVDETFDLYEVIEQTRDILFINILTKNIDLNLIIYSDTPRWVSGDKLRLKQILLNLIGNAIKFTDQGQVVIRVSIQQEYGSEVMRILEDECSLEASFEIPLTPRDLDVLVYLME